MSQRLSPVTEIISMAASCCPYFCPPSALVCSQYSSHHEPLKQKSDPGTPVLTTTQKIPSQSEWKPSPHKGQLVSVRSPLTLLVPPGSELSAPHPILTRSTWPLLCSCFRALTLAVTSAWHALPSNICNAPLSPPSSNCSNGIFSVSPTLPPFKM